MTGPAKSLMLQGTGSDVGKSLLVAGMARAYTSRGLNVRPFKPQNMSNNAAVTADGGEIGRAQALQARACGVAASIHMNPVLLKPQSDKGAQVVVHGRIFANANARDYHEMKPKLMEKVLESFHRMTDEGGLVLVEGAGSPAEINLRAGDIANMGFALAARVPVFLVADIDRGGAIASIVGTHALLDDDERALISGFIINKFRGDKTLLQPALDEIEARTGFLCAGVIPWFEDAWRLPSEDAVALQRQAMPKKNGAIKIIVPRLPRIANFDDLDPLAAEEDVDVQFIQRGEAIPANADVVILPGSKSTLDDLKNMRASGWDVDILAHSRRGGMVVGLCAGFQMLGQTIADRFGREGAASGPVPGLGLLDINTEISDTKALGHVQGMHRASGTKISGYEMHMGVTLGDGLARSMLLLDDDRPDGAVSASGLTMGCYVHGLFRSDTFRSFFLDQLRQGRLPGEAHEARVDATLDSLARHIEANMNLDALLKLTRI
jgi:adenosylcobyric acid synthase